MAHGYRHLQHWNQWLSQHFLGKSLLDAESKSLSSLLERHFGKQALLIGVPHQFDLLKSTVITHRFLLSPLIFHEHSHALSIEGDFAELPILTGSLDLVIIPHTLEFIDNPRQLLAEACRVTKPEGLIVISGFNPYSGWGLKRKLAKHKNAPWCGRFIQSTKIKGWLRLADFQIEQQQSILFRPPIANKNIYQKLGFLEWAGKIFFPYLGGTYILLARAKAIPLTPIRMKWKQPLSGIHISTTMTGHIARQSKNLSA